MKNLPQAPTNKNNLRVETRGDRRSKDEETKMMSAIFSLSSDHNDYEIMDILKIPNSTYYRLKGKMYEQAKDFTISSGNSTLSYALRILISYPYMYINNADSYY